MGKEDAHRATICKDTDFVRYEQTRKGRFVWILFCLVPHFLLLTNVVRKEVRKCPGISDNLRSFSGLSSCLFSLSSCFFRLSLSSGWFLRDIFRFSRMIFLVDVS